jgi:hypothetical protein
MKKEEEMIQINQGRSKGIERQSWRDRKNPGRVEEEERDGKVDSKTPRECRMVKSTGEKWTRKRHS